MSRCPPLKMKKPPPHVTLITVEGTELAIPMETPPPGSFTYAGRLWAFNELVSKRAGKAIFSQITAAVVEDMRRQATTVLAIADRYEAQLGTIENPAPPPGAPIM